MSVGTKGTWGVGSPDDLITFSVFVVFRIEIKDVDGTLIHVQQFIGVDVRHIKKFAKDIQQAFPPVFILAHAGSPGHLQRVKCVAS